MKTYNFDELLIKYLIYDNSECILDLDLILSIFHHFYTL